MKEAIDKKHLAGLKFKSSKKVKTDDGVKHQAFERALQPTDVLAWSDQGATVTIVAADGQKHVVEKKAA